ncbi:hypothetical protein ES703_110532 [subsurface metagenome]|jgi:hypothetical protein
MHKTISRLNTKDYSKQFKRAREERTKKLASLPYSKKIAIVEELQVDYSVIRKSVSSLKPSKT